MINVDRKTVEQVDKQKTNSQYFSPRQNLTIMEAIKQEVPPHLPQKYEKFVPSRQENLNRSKVLFRMSLLPLFAMVGVVVFSYVNTNLSSFPVLEPGPDNSINYLLAEYVGIYEIYSNASTPIAIGSEEGEIFSLEPYIVQPNDTVSTIAAAKGISPATLLFFNAVQNTENLKVGEMIRIPTIDGISYTVQYNEGLAHIAFQFHIPLEVLMTANNLTTEMVAPGTVLFIPGARMPEYVSMEDRFIFPVNGTVSSMFGWRIDPIRNDRRTLHAAIDIKAPKGSIIVAAMSGRITVIGANASFGQFIILNHNSHYQSLYAHIAKISVSQGDFVMAGSPIGELGSQDLHFSIYKDGNAVNPLDYIVP
ncbi:hypothetical protein PilKf_01736 [Pillotina sp. SPG140]|jgi:murein DD-endopeptidase MepM/ murein hydrolase activator NlpD